jgi:hypothetical protein
MPAQDIREVRLPVVAESAATGEVAALYTEIREHCARVRCAEVERRSAVTARLTLAETAARTATPCPLLLASHGRS